MGKSEAPRPAIRTRSKDVRHAAILAELRASPSIRIADLAAEYDVSTETIRRDLDAMSAAGLINRTYGGAIGAPATTEAMLDERYGTYATERSAIARTVVDLVRQGDSLMIDAGATMIFVARRLAVELNHLTVITTSFGVATALATNSSVRVRMAPGDYDARDGGVMGTDTVEYLNQFNVSHAILGASSLNEAGASDFNTNSVAIKRAMISRAKNVIVAVHGEKLGQVGFQQVCDLSSIDYLVTDNQPSQRLMSVLGRNHVAVRVSK